MNAYDFDNTIYDGESALDFFWFCMRKKPVLVKVLFPVLRDLVRYKTCRMTKEEFRDRGAYYTESFFDLFDDIHEKHSFPAYCTTCVRLPQGEAAIFTKYLKNV